MDKPLLSLETLISRPNIEVDGKAYEMLSPDELSVLDSQRFGAWGKRMDELAKADADDDAVLEELTGLVDRASRRLLPDMPDEIFAKLSGAARQSIVEVFTWLQLRGRQRMAGAVQTIMPNRESRPSQPTGESSSPASSGSTEPTPVTG